MHIMQPNFKAVRAKPQRPYFKTSPLEGYEASRDAKPHERRRTRLREPPKSQLKELNPI